LEAGVRGGAVEWSGDGLARLAAAVDGEVGVRGAVDAGTLDDGRLECRHGLDELLLGGLECLALPVLLQREEDDDEPEHQNENCLDGPVDYRDHEEAESGGSVLEDVGLRGRVVHWQRIITSVERLNPVVDVDGRLVDDVQRVEGDPRVEVQTTWTPGFNAEESDD